MQRIYVFVLLSVAIVAIQSCSEREEYFNRLIGSWQGSTGPEHSWCTTYLDDGRFHLFSRVPTVPVSIDHSGSVVKPPDQQAPVMGVSYSVGYWWVERGGRFWQRGTMIRDASGTEYPQQMRVLRHSGKYAVRFQSDDQFVLHNIDDKDERPTLLRVSNCENFREQVDMNLKEPAFFEQTAE